MNTLKAGFSRVDITPPLGIALGGMFEARYNIEVLDPLCATCLAVSDGENTALLVSTDLLYIPDAPLKRLKDVTQEVTGIAPDNMFFHATHTHNGPILTVTEHSREIGKDHLTTEYIEFLAHRVADVCQQAIWDMKPAKMGWTVGKAPNVAFIRRFRMKDGSIVTNPGINNPNIVETVGNLDDRVNILKFKRGEGDTITLVNFGNHPCVVNGPRVSADWPGYMYRFVEQAIPETKCIFFNGCQGDVNHVNVFPGETDRYLNYDPDDKYKEVRRSFAEYMGRAMAGTVMQEYDKVKYIEVDKIQSAIKTIKIPSNKGTAEELEKALALQAKMKEIGIPEMRKLYPEMEFETVMGEAGRIVRLKDAPEFNEMNVSAVAIGKVAFVGIPGEPFSGVSFMLKDTKDWEMVLPCCCTNGRKGYFPMMEDYAEGAYEACSSDFKAGAAEQIVATGKEMLAEFIK